MHSWTLKKPTQARREEEQAEGSAPRGVRIDVGDKRLYAWDDERQAQAVPSAKGHCLIRNTNTRSH
jgi:hypothetical protein